MEGDVINQKAPKPLGREGEDLEVSRELYIVVKIFHWHHRLHGIILPHLNPVEFGPKWGRNGLYRRGRCRKMRTERNPNGDPIEQYRIKPTSSDQLMKVICTFCSEDHWDCPIRWKRHLTEYFPSNGGTAGNSIIFGGLADNR